MIQIVEDLWVGTSDDGCNRFGQMLNVAHDLPCVHGWPETLYMQVGLMDGPGNELALYSAAVLMLSELMKRGPVMVYCHSGGRSMAVILMYLHVMTGLGWDGCLEMVEERVDGIKLPTIHEAHREAFDRMDWSLVRSLIGHE